MDPFAELKEAQKKGWVHFAPLEMHTIPAAAKLLSHARVREGDRVLDVACGTGVVAVSAARAGARVRGVDFTPELLERARENATLAGVRIEWSEGDVEQLPFEDAAFDVVLSQFGHIFAPRPEVAVAELTRVLKPGGTLAFATWPPELFVGRSLALAGRYAPPPPGAAAPQAWGDPGVVRERLGARVRDIAFDRATLFIPALSPQHQRAMIERTAGPLIKLVEALSASDPERLATFRREYEALVAEYHEHNLIRQDYLLTRAHKLGG